MDKSQNLPLRDRSLSVDNKGTPYQDHEIATYALDEKANCEYKTHAFWHEI